jgi:hypothetical protein
VDQKNDANGFHGRARERRFFGAGLSAAIFFDDFSLEALSEDGLSLAAGGFWADGFSGDD